MKQTDFARTLTLFLTDFLPGQRNVSPHTIASYRDTFKQFLLFMQDKQQVRPERISFATLTAPSIKDFLQWLETSRQVSISTRNQRLAAIHSFFRFAQAENPEILFESHLTLDQLACLFEQPDTSTKEGTS
ncbi:site-specific integrase [Paenibacillus sp. JMULE4]|uniref:tyrosine-type recombinase/integrase n=1 Tax=Paenibacillus sp. JMULE4 TaxID=2518342 RepID=UPI0020C7213B|nr:site-specific integrase [Paenibacillus sp. JMULE4]